MIYQKQNFCLECRTRQLVSKAEMAPRDQEVTQTEAGLWGSFACTTLAGNSSAKVVKNFAFDVNCLAASYENRSHALEDCRCHAAVNVSRVAAPGLHAGTGLKGCKQSMVLMVHTSDSDQNSSPI